MSYKSEWHLQDVQKLVGKSISIKNYIAHKAILAGNLKLWLVKNLQVVFNGVLNCLFFILAHVYGFFSG